MNKVYFVISCLFVAQTVVSIEQSRAAVFVNLYNEKLNFFDSFLSPYQIDSLLLTVKDISPETISTLRSAWIPYTTLHGEIISWCIELKNTVEPLSSVAMKGESASNKMLQALQQMKKYFDSIATNGQNKNVEDYKAFITIIDGVLKFEVINGHTPENIQEQLWPLLEKSKQVGFIAEDVKRTPFDDNVQYAKEIINEAINAYYNSANNYFNREDTITKCQPVLDKFETSRTSPKPPIQTITPSSNDILRINPKGCGPKGYRSTLCEAFLSKSTMEQLKNLFRNEDTVASFFNALDSSDSSLDCRNSMKLFIKNSFISWAYYVPKMGNIQSMRISICPYFDKSPQINIVP